MRKFCPLILIFFIAITASAQAVQGQKNGISFKALLMDYQSQNGGNIDAIKDYQYGFEIGYHRLLNDRLSLNVPIKFGNVNAAGSNLNDGLHEKVLGLDVQAQYNFLKPFETVNPYVTGGLGAVSFLNSEMDAQVPLGLGLNIKVAPGAFINVQAEYRYSLIVDRSNLHYGLGFKFFPGAFDEEKDDKEMEMEEKDSDGDGISDKLDLCPDIAGLKEFNGCPDTDKDGVPDYEDKCPKVKGVKAMMGCPDTDGDGLSDNDDECPNVAGPIENKGCPVKDSDGDGIPDDKDNCPNIAGIAANNGCPEINKTNDRDGDGVEDSKDRCPDAPGPKAYNGCPDSDGDGLDDSIDRCPKTPGTVAANGCPEITQEDKKTLDVAMRAVQFDTGKSSLKAESFTILKQIANIMNRYPDYNLVISGHTDNVGSAVANQDLSERRAKACLDYLATQGIARTRLSSAGYGESRPVSSNDTEAGRTLNRRVEFIMLPR